MDEFIQKFKNYDWRRLKRLASAQASSDFNQFMDKLPQNVGQTMIGFVAAVWIFVGGAGLYTMIQLQSITELRAELTEVNALRPTVPKLVMKPVRGAEIKEMAEKMSKIYPSLDIQASGAAITLAADSTVHFGQFREAIGHVQASGKNVRADIQSMCVGRECDKKPLSVSLKINKISVN